MSAQLNSNVSTIVQFDGNYTGNIDVDHLPKKTNNLQPKKPKNETAESFDENPLSFDFWQSNYGSGEYWRTEFVSVYEMQGVKTRPKVFSKKKKQKKQLPMISMGLLLHYDVSIDSEPQLHND